MVVNALVTGLIVFKILEVFLEVKATSMEQTLGSLNSTEGPKLRHIIFIIVESGMALFAIQLGVVILGFKLPVTQVIVGQTPLSFKIAYDVVVVIHQTLNVIIRSILFFLLILFY
jgi:hypothetical protein